MVPVKSHPLRADKTHFEPMPAVRERRVQRETHRQKNRVGTGCKCTRPATRKFQKIKSWNSGFRAQMAPSPARPIPALPSPAQPSAPRLVTGNLSPRDLEFSSSFRTILGKFRGSWGTPLGNPWDSVEYSTEVAVAAKWVPRDDFRSNSMVLGQTGTSAKTIWISDRAISPVSACEDAP